MNEIRSNAKVKKLSRHVRVKHLQWHDHLCWRVKDEDIHCVMEMKVSGKRKSRRRQRWSDVIRTDMRRWDLERDDTQDSVMALPAITRSLQNGYPDSTTAGYVRKVREKNNSMRNQCRYSLVWITPTLVNSIQMR